MTDGPPEIHLFVYGTLRSGGVAAWLLRGCRLVGPGAVAGTLYDLGAYPALVLGEDSRVEGEVWRCPPGLLVRLDEYEGVAEGLFGRTEVEAAGVRCWTYVAGPLLLPGLAPQRRIAAGCWPPGAGEGGGGAGT